MQFSGDNATQNARGNINSHNVNLQGESVHHHVHRHSSEPTRPQVATAQPRCPLPSPKFVGRSRELSRLKNFFTRSDLDWKTFVLIGMGGCGKSQIASQYTHGSVFKEDMYKPSMVFFVDATTVTTLEESYAAIAKCKGVGTSSKDALLWLSSVQEPSFTLIDNADSPNLDLRDYMPRSTHAHILITTRLHDEGRQYASADDAFLELDALPAPDAEELLMRTAMLGPDSLRGVAVLVEELYCHPLAIAQAGACIAHLRLPVDRYLERYCRLGTSLMDGRNDGVGAQALYGYSKVVSNSWTLSYDELPTPSKALFDLCAFFHHTDISQDLFERATNALKNYKPTVPFSRSEEAAFATVIRVLESFQTDERSFDYIAFLKCISPILSLSLMRLDSATKMLSIHPLILDSLRRIASNHLPTSLLLTLAISFSEEDALFLCPLVPHVDSIVGRADLAELSSHPNRYHPDIAMAFSFAYTASGRYQPAEYLQSATVARRTMVLGRDDEKTLRASSSLCITLNSMGQLVTAEALGRTLRADWIRAYGEDHSGTLKTSLELAETLGGLWRYFEVETLELEVLSRRRRLLGDDHPDTVAVIGALAGTFNNTGRYEEAEAMGREVLSRRKRLLGEDHPDTVAAMGALASTLRDSGQYQEAETMELEVLSRQRHLLGEDHPDTAQAMSNLAITLYNLGRYSETESMELEVLSRRRRLLGEDHPDVAQAMSNLATTLYKVGRYREAEAMELEVLSRRRRLLGEDHPDTMSAMGALASTLHNFGRYQEAEKMKVEVLSRSRHLLGEDHPDVAQAMSNLAITLHKVGRHREAETMEREVLSRHKRVLGEDHPDTAWTMRNLAITLYRLGRYQEAETMELEILSRHGRLLGEDHPDTAQAMSNLAITLDKLGRHHEAETMKVDVLSRCRRLLGEDHPDTVSAMNALAMTLHNSGRYQEAETLEVEVLSRRRRLLGESHPDTVSAMGALFGTLDKLGRYQEAETIGREVLSRHRHLLGEEHPDTLTTMNNLAAVFCNLERWDEAEMLHREVLVRRRRILGEDHPGTINSMKWLARIASLRERGVIQEAAEEQDGLRDSPVASAPLEHSSSADEETLPDIRVTEVASPVLIPDSDVTVSSRRRWIKKLKDHYRRS